MKGGEPMKDSTQLIVKPITADRQTKMNPSLDWAPVIGNVTNRFLEEIIPPESKEEILNSATSILSKGVSPELEKGEETGLVVGYVQSGKTMSFETVAALANDNGFRIVIIIAGISTLLLDQSSGRLQMDLGLNDSKLVRNWILLKNPSGIDDQKTIQESLDEWNDPRTPEKFKKTVLITVLKHHKWLSNLTEILKKINLERSPVLIIDDEADQASLNTEVNQLEGSATYRYLMKLREVLAHHTYLQYTATPQAPLLINIIDSLSPNFVEVLNPGENYVGGVDFFSNRSKYIKVIPDADMPTSNSDLTDPPESLFDALRIFLVGVAVGLLENGDVGNRSMLIHPSHRTVYHQTYFYWVERIFEEWKMILNDEDSPDYNELVDEYIDSYNELSKTAEQHLPEFSEILDILPVAFRNISVKEVNATSGKTPQIDWRRSYGWILVGGQAMDRGFTVEGLTVTYMPRGIGVGNADTLQQRARFFGYKRSYLDFCRIFIDDTSLRAFENYVEHEEDIREQLKSLALQNISLNDWKRNFILSPELKPCRNQVLQYGYTRSNFSDDWVAARYIYAPENIITANQDAVDNFKSTLDFEESEGHEDRTPSQLHLVCKDISLRRVINELLVKMRISGTADSERITGMLLQLSDAVLEDPEEKCDVYIMSPREPRVRSLDSSEEITLGTSRKISELFQGAHPVSPERERGRIYPGDREIKSKEKVTVQIHELDIKREKEYIARRVPVVAVWIPKRLGQSRIIQEQPYQGVSDATL